MSEQVSSTCSGCNALMAPTMAKCPRCGISRVLPTPPMPPPTNESNPRQVKPKSNTGLNQDLFGRNGIWVALILYMASPVVEGFGFVGLIVGVIMFLFAYVINVGWTIRRASDKGYPYLGILGILPILGPIVIACIPRRAGVETVEEKELILAKGQETIVYGQAHQPINDTQLENPSSND